jgi:hypothetical protein
LGRLLYDDFDPMARALRGLNACLGRFPGRLAEPPTKSPEEFTAALKQPSQVLEPAYFLEYPHAALWLFELSYAFRNRVDERLIPPAVQDAYFLNIVEHYPTTPTEEQLWSQFRRAIQTYAVVGALGLVGIMLVLQIGYAADQGAGRCVWLLVLPASLYFAVNRFDVVPALLTALSVACLGRRWLVLSGAFLAAGAMVKVYPLLLAPLFFRCLSSDRGARWSWGLAFLATMAGLVAAAVAQFGWEAALAPYRFQLARDWEGWSLYGYVLPPFLARTYLASRLFRSGTFLLVLLWLVWKRPRDLNNLLGSAAIALIVFASLQVFYSPQWLLWYSPFVVPLARTRVLRGLLIALDLITFLSFPVVYDLPGSGIEEVLKGALVYARCLCLAFLVYCLLRKKAALPSHLATS